MAVIVAIIVVVVMDEVGSILVLACVCCVVSNMCVGWWQEVECWQKVEAPHESTGVLTKSLEDGDSVAISDVYFSFGEYDCAVGVAETSNAEEVVDKRLDDITIIGPRW
jgi:hypothetical protein